MRALVERVVVGSAGADIRLRVEGLAGLVHDLGTVSLEALRGTLHDGRHQHHCLGAAEDPPAAGAEDGDARAGGRAVTLPSRLGLTQHC